MKQCAVNLKLKLKETGYTTIKTILIPNPTTNGIEDLKIVSDRSMLSWCFLDLI